MGSSLVYWTKLFLILLLQLLYLFKVEAHDISIDSDSKVELFTNHGALFKRHLSQERLEDLPQCSDPSIEPQQYSCNCITYDALEIKQMTAVIF